MALGDRHVIEEALDWARQGRGVALATVVETWGSSPRPRGSQLVVRDDGLFLGSVSGGCVEGKVVEAAHRVMASRAPELLEFGVSNDEAWEVGLACGGTVHILVEPANKDVLEDAARAIGDRRAAVIVTPLGGEGAARVWSPGDPSLGDALGDAALRALATDDAVVVGRDSASAGRSITVGEGPARVLLTPLNPKLTLVITGAVHTAAPLASIATALGYAVTVIDPRAAFARAERWPKDLAVVTAWPDEALASMRLDHRAAVVALSHDPKIDDPALIAALKTPAFYVGALGSKKTHASRQKRLVEAGFDERAIARVRGPIGLPIGARSPAEIAVAIAAEMTQELRRGAGIARA